MFWVTIVVSIAFLVGLVAWRRGDGQGPQEDGSQFWAWLDFELERARRNGRAVTLICIPSASRASVRDPSHEMDAQDPARLRASDHVLRTRDGIWVLAPETDAVGSELMVRRLGLDRQAAEQRARIASFPEDELTRHALIERVSTPPPSAARPGRTVEPRVT